MTDQFDVHHSHVLHFADHTRENRIYGEPLLKRVLDSIFNLDKTFGGMGEMIWRDGKRRFIAELREGYSWSSPQDREDRKEQIAAFSHDMLDVLQVTGTDIKAMSGQIPNLDGNILRQMQMVAGILDVPMRKIFGSEMGQLATSEDNKAYNKKIMGRQKHIIIPRIVRPFINRLVAAGVLHPPQDLIIKPADLLALTQTERAEIDRAYVQNVSDFVGPMGDPESVITREEFRTHALSQWGLPAENEDLPDPGMDDDEGGDD